MQRDARAYLADILDSCDAIDSAIAGMGLSDYLGSRLVRSSVEREFTIIGEAVLALSHKSPESFDAITGARRIIDFRNRLTHEYPMVDDELGGPDPLDRSAARCSLSRRFNYAALGRPVEYASSGVL
jgi:uncharacterized protein with HEPN domain